MGSSQNTRYLADDYDREVRWQTQHVIDVLLGRIDTYAGPTHLRRYRRRRNPEPWYARHLQGDLYRGTTTAAGGGSGVGVLGMGIYLAWQQRVAQAFASIASDRQGGEPLVVTYQVRPGLRLLERLSPEWNSIMAGLGMNPEDKVANQSFASLLTHRVRELGYDGVISRDPYDGLVIFDSSNVVGYQDPLQCRCGKRKLACERCGHAWCAWGCESQYGDCPQCGICKTCGDDELEECYECNTLYCYHCEGECPRGCD